MTRCWKRVLPAVVLVLLVAGLWPTMAFAGQGMGQLASGFVTQAVQNDDLVLCDVDGTRDTLSNRYGKSRRVMIFGRSNCAKTSRVVGLAEKMSEWGDYADINFMLFFAWGEKDVFEEEYKNHETEKFRVYVAHTDSDLSSQNRWLYQAERNAVENDQDGFAPVVLYLDEHSNVLAATGNDGGDETTKKGEENLPARLDPYDVRLDKRVEKYFGVQRKPFLFSLIEADFSNTYWHQEASTFTYDGQPHEPRGHLRASVSLVNFELDEGTAYECSYLDNVDAGQGKLCFTGKGVYEGLEKTLAFEIKPASLERAYVRVDDQQYTGTALTPVPVVSLGGIVLKKGIDYDTSYVDNVNVGSASVTVAGKGNYAGSITESFQIFEQPDMRGDDEEGQSANSERSESADPEGGGSEDGGFVREDLAIFAAKALCFTDLDADAWYMTEGFGDESGKVIATYLDYAVGRGLMSGYTGGREGQFGPDDALSRGMAATIIYRMATGATAKTANNAVDAGFPDVARGEWYAAAVKWCAERGVVTGYRDGTGRFGPDDRVTREQLAAMLTRFCVQVEGMRPPSQNAVYHAFIAFDDWIFVSDWAEEGVAFCNARGVMTGIGSTGLFDPQGSATRCQMAKIIAVTARMVE